MDEIRKALPGLPPAHDAAAIAPHVGDMSHGDGRTLLANGTEIVVTDNLDIVISYAPTDKLSDLVTIIGAMPLAFAADGAIATADGNYLPPFTLPPPTRAEPDDFRPRSPLRDGTAIDGLAPGCPLRNSLLERSDLCQVEPPIDPSTDFTRCSRFARQLKKATETVVRCDPFELAATGRTAIEQFHQPKVKEISARKLPYRTPSDPIDPVVIFVEAIPLAYRVLHQDPSGTDGLDIDGAAYIIERLGEAECLRTHEQDIRFDVLQALSAFLVAILDKEEEERWVCVEAA